MCQPLAAFPNADAGTGKYVTVTYNLTDGTNGGLASNYSIADGAGSVTISPATLTLSTLNVADKTYDAVILQRQPSAAYQDLSARRR